MVRTDFHEDDQTELDLHSAICIKSSVKGYHTYKDMDSCNEFEIGYLKLIKP